MKPVRAVLFDLDGTLVQTREASWRLFARTNEAFGLGVDTQADFFRLLEDNMFYGLRKHCRDERKADEAASHFLSLLEREYNPDFVPGMSDVIKALAGNCSLAVISSNSVATIRRILSRENIVHCFSHVFGGDVEQDKRASVRRFLSDKSYLVNRDCSPAYREGDEPQISDGDQIVLITDTVGDVKHARECGIRAIGVAWGMHSEPQLLAAGAEFVAVWPQELVSHLLPGGFAATFCGITPTIASPRGSAVALGAHECDCGCRSEDLAGAASIRRKRTIAASAALELRLACGGDDRDEGSAGGAQIGATNADDLLLRSLARLRGQILRRTANMSNVKLNSSAYREEDR
jgi:phosphoglycolate phosphatase